MRYILLICIFFNISANFSIILAAPNAQEAKIAILMKNNSSQGRPNLIYNSILNSVARARAADMAKRRYFDHVNPDGNGPNYLVNKAGYGLPALYLDNRANNYIESILAGIGDPDAAWAKWLDSAPHKRHLLAENSFYKEQYYYGVGYYYDQSSPYKHYYVVITCPAPKGISFSELKYNSVVKGQNTVISGNFNGSLSWEGGNINLIKPFSETVSLIPGLNHFTATVLIDNVAENKSFTIKRLMHLNITGNGSIKYPEWNELNSNVSVSAIPNRGYLFNQWSDNTYANPRVINMSEDIEMNADFTVSPFLTMGGSYIFNDWILTLGSSGIYSAKNLINKTSLKGKLELRNNTFFDYNDGNISLNSEVGSKISREATGNYTYENDGWLNFSVKSNGKVVALGRNDSGPWAGSGWIANCNVGNISKTYKLNRTNIDGNAVFEYTVPPNTATLDNMNFIFNGDLFTGIDAFGKISKNGVFRLKSADSEYQGVYTNKLVGYNFKTGKFLNN